MQVKIECKCGNLIMETNFKLPARIYADRYTKEGEFVGRMCDDCWDKHPKNDEDPMDYLED